MKIILSPAKQMVRDVDTLAPTGLPVFPEQTRLLLEALRGMDYEKLKLLWQCSDKLARESYEMLQNIRLEGPTTPAVLAYSGIAYKYMLPGAFDNDEFDYVQRHLRILSGFYGVLKPMDGVEPYRLEMQAKLSAAGARDLYAFWSDRLYREVLDDSHIIINLASGEYSRCIESYLTKEDTCITCVFGQLAGGKVVQKGVYAKMARGEMVRYMAQHNIESPHEMKTFDRLGYRYRQELSDENTYTFIKP